jgi:hypothetical protein
MGEESIRPGHWNMAHIPPENLELVNKFVALSTTLIVRQKAIEIALAKLGLSEATWTAALEEAGRSVASVPFPESDQPLEAYLETITATLNNP